MVLFYLTVHSNYKENQIKIYKQVNKQYTTTVNFNGITAKFTSAFFLSQEVPHCRFCHS